MGLDSLVHERGHVHSSKEAEDISFDEHSWIRVLHFNTDAIYTLVSGNYSNTLDNEEKEEIRYFIELIDKMLEKEVALLTSLSDDDINELESSREKLVEKLEGER